MDWDDAYHNAGYIPDSDRYPDRWARRARAFRRRWPHATIDVPYGDTARERLDLFRPETKPRGLAVFVHGGYWMRFDKSFWSDLAEGGLRRGWAVALPSYALAPQVRISQITKQVAAAVERAAAMVDGPVRLAGHSAGGHLVARMVCRDGPLNANAAERIEKAVPISGLHDLHPLMRTRMNETLRIDAAEAAAESPALLPPLGGARVCAWVGGEERPEFVRQSRLLADAWPSAELRIDETLHHFSVIEGLRAPDSPLVEALLA